MRFLLFLTCGLACSLAATAEVRIPAGYEPGKEAFADNQDARGQFLGITKLRGRPLKADGAIAGIYLVKVPEAQPEDGMFMIGDVISHLNGSVLASDPIFRIKSLMAEVSEEAGKVTMTRWRGGRAVEVAYQFEKPTAPDLTRGGKHDPDGEDWTLGATGAHGWTWAIPHKTTAGATQAYVTKVEAGSPADGVLKAGDVITGAFGSPFTHDFRKEFGAALTRAEADGKLVLDVWHAGKTRQATLKLKVMGAYADGMPADCPKVSRIIDDGCAHLMKVGLGGGIASYVNALGLMATGREDVMPVVKAFVAGEVAKPGSTSAWTCGYSTLVLSEYFLLTGDESVLPAIRERAMIMAQGQSDVGTWGHSMCRPYPFSDGPVVGIAPGYGALNAAGVVCVAALQMATRCGVDSDEIQTALKRSREFFHYFVDKGCIPYGDHEPGVSKHEDNGKTSTAAVAFDLMGDSEAATFFAKMSTASFNEREGGHTGNYFSFLWGPLGAARAGDAAHAAFMKKLEWFFEFERGWQGNFDYQGKPGMPNKRGSEHAYKGWDCTGARLLAYSVPRKRLFLTGKGRTVADLTGKALDEVVVAGDLLPADYHELTAAQLLEKLHSWSPAARRHAAVALGRKPDHVVDALIAMLDSDNRYARYGALEGLRFAGRGSARAADAIVERVRTTDDEEFLFFAVTAFSNLDEAMGLGAVADRAATAFLELAARPGASGPVANIKSLLTQSLFYSANSRPLRSFFRHGDGVEQVDRRLLVDAVRELLKVRNGVGRSQTAIVYPHLTDEQRKDLWPDIYQASRRLAPSGIMFANGVRTDGIALMCEQRSKEGLEMAVWYLTNMKLHGGETRCRDMLDLIVTTYGGHARTQIPNLRKVIAHYEAGEGQHPRQASLKKADLVREAIKRIEAAPVPEWELTSIAGYLD